MGCFKRFGWTQADFRQVLNPSVEFQELLKGLFIPNYGNTDYVRQVPQTNMVEFRDPVDNYYL